MHHFVNMGKNLESYFLSEPHEFAQMLILLRSNKTFV
jgi:hypothetical protein